MAVAGIRATRLRVIRAPVEQHRLHAGCARGIEFLDHVGQEHDVRGPAIERIGDQPVAVGVALVADFGVEECGEQLRQVAGLTR